MCQSVEAVMSGITAEPSVDQGCFSGKAWSFSFRGVRVTECCVLHSVVYAYKVLSYPPNFAGTRNPLFSAWRKHPWPTREAGTENVV